ncbi:hypothetical protein ACF044_16490 [Microbacterium sp. NPDC016588]|uniref:hypothetical protein n=1 Tax=Microbacterium TaxID=33882 RepID=UPI0007F4F925|nr:MULTISPECIES: hypothetical protein [unclassified Microbacterium]OAN39358.1 hypothetical protein A4X16_14620 [Microbacterium sp. H83]TCJ21213.1 hypothetical protein E0W80_17335 [Microbacterium sp. PI-1]
MTQEATARICLAGITGSRGYCGRKATSAATAVADVTCKDCSAAVRADQQAGILSPELTAAIAC